MTAERAAGDGEKMTRSSRPAQGVGVKVAQAQDGRSEARRAVVGSGVAPRATQAATERSTGVLSVIVPFPPSTNRLYATVRGRRVKTQEARDYAESVFVLTRAVVNAAGEVPLPPFALALDVWVPDLRRHDLSNLVKCCEDAVFAAIGWDDCHVDRLVVERRGLDRIHPRVVVTVTGRAWPALTRTSGAARAQDGGQG